jgi:hypothetical protein
MELIQIVPHLPPAPEGVGGYAAALAVELRERLGVESRFAIDAATAAGLGGSTVLLHYANYGYQTRGCPVSLVHGLLSWKRSAAGRRLVTIFHEVYASGPPWRSSFWTSPLQRRLAAALARGGDGAVTSLELYAGLLKRLAPGVEVHVLPIFSTVGEPENVPPLSERSRTMVVFGGPGARDRAYGEQREALEAACQAWRIQEILDIGPALSSVPSNVGNIPVRTLGPLPASEVSRLLLGSFAGFLAYPSTFLGKSTIFAAYCAHGLLPVQPGEKADPGVAQERATAAREWYLRHSLARQADQLLGLLKGEGA